MTALEDERAAHWVCVKMRDEALAENERLRSVLGVALEEHDGNEGRLAPDFMPHHWTHEARRILEQIEEPMSLNAP